MRWRPTLWMVLVAVNLLIVTLPLIAFTSLKLYENELVRGTEAQLLTLAAALRDAYRESYDAAAAVRLGAPQPSDPLPEDDPPRDGAAGELLEHVPNAIDPELAPAALLPELDVTRDEPLPDAPEASAPTLPADPIAQRAGRRIARQVESVAAAMLTGVRIVDRNGIVVASSGAEFGMSLKGREEVDLSLRGERVSLRRTRPAAVSRLPSDPRQRTGSARVLVALPVLSDGIVVGSVIASRTPPGLMQSLWAQRRAVTVGLIAIVVIGALVTLLTYATLGLPLVRLMRRAEAVGSGGEQLPFAPGLASVREVDQLASALDGMATALEQRTSYVRGLANHVSHEFKTPLSTLRGTIELLQDHGETLSSEQRGRLHEILAVTVNRLERLTARLLELARADMATPHIGRVLLAPFLAAFVAQRQAQGQRCASQLGDAALAVQADAELLEKVLHILCDNARLHAGDGARVVIEADAPPIGSIIRIVVSDDGAGISEANRQRLFTPFFTTARERGGTGLGLAIARRLLAAQTGTIESMARGSGASFVITLPRADA